MSQLDLAGAAENSPRHISFIETGRSHRGRGLMLRIATAPDIPPRDQNALLSAASLSEAFFNELAASIKPTRFPLRELVCPQSLAIFSSFTRENYENHH